MFKDTTFPLKTVYQFSKRVATYKYETKGDGHGIISYAWFVWDKDSDDTTKLGWIEPGHKKAAR